MIRTICLCAGLLSGGFIGDVAVAQTPSAQNAAAPADQSARNPLAPPTTAGWSCQDGRCAYHKAQGGWADCFTAWSPTHGGWLPTRYCR